MAAEQSAPALSQQPSDALIDLYFDCEAPDERDALCDALAGRSDPVAVAFFAAMLEEDEDPYLQVTAAAALLADSVHGPRARGHLLAVLQHSTDELLFEEALFSLLQQPPAELYDVLEGIGGDRARDVLERRLARVAMEQLDGPRAVQASRALVGSKEALAGEPLDLVAVALATLVRSGTIDDKAAIDAAARALPQGAAHLWDADDLGALLDLFEEAQAVVHADAEDAPLEP